MSYERINTPRGPVHVWMPKGASRRRGTVVYVHGFFNTADQAMEKHRLIEQFANSGMDATFIVPEAPWKSGQGIHFPDLSALLRLVNQSVQLGSGPIIIMGHSAAHGTLRRWLDGQVQHIILLDALYGGRSEFAAWARDPTRRLTVIGQQTGSESRKLVQSLGGRYLPSIPAPFPRDRIIGAKSQWGHHAIVEDGIVIPLLLQSTDLPKLDRSIVPWIASALAVVALGFGGYYWYSRRATRRPD